MSPVVYWFPRAWIGIAAVLLCPRLAAAEDTRPLAPDEAGIHARVDGILSMYDSEGDPLNALVPVFLAHEGKAAVPYLVSLVEGRSAQENPSRGARRQAPAAILVDALGRVTDERALAALERWMTRGPADQRAAAARAVGRYHSRTSLESLVHALGQEDLQARAAVVQALVETSRALPGLDVAPMLVEAAKKDVTLRDGVAEALAEIGGPTAAGFLHDLLDDTDPYVRAHAVKLAARGSPEEAGEWLEPLLGDESLLVRKETCVALGHLKTMAAIPDLIALLEPDTDAGLRANAWWALREISGRALADDPSLWRRWWEANQPKPEEK